MESKKHLQELEDILNSIATDTQYDELGGVPFTEEDIQEFGEFEEFENCCLESEI